MKTLISKPGEARTGVKLWLSARDTYNWATKPGASWPCSQLRGLRLFVDYDRNGLCDIAINGKSGDCDANELNAIVADFLRPVLSVNHPCYDVIIGQFDAKK